MQSYDFFWDYASGYNNITSLSEYTLRVCIFRARCTLLAGISIVDLNLGKIKSEYTMRVCIYKGVFCGACKNKKETALSRLFSVIVL